MSGKRVFKTSFLGNLNNTILHPKLQKGVYVVRLQNHQGALSRKIIID